MQLTTDRVPGPYASGGGSARGEPNLRFLKGRAGGGAPAGGSAPWSARARVLCVMLHRPRSTGRVSRPPPGTGGPEGAADAAGAQDTAVLRLRSREESHSGRGHPGRRPHCRRVLDGVGPATADLLWTPSHRSVLRGMRLWGPGWGAREGVPSASLAASGAMGPRTKGVGYLLLARIPAGELPDP